MNFTYVVTVHCILKPVALYELKDDGLDLFRRMVGGREEAQVKVHWFLAGSGDDPAPFDADGQVEEDSGFDRFRSVRG